MRPYVVVARTFAANYILSDLNKVLLGSKIAGFCILPFYSRKDQINLGKKFYNKLYAIKDGVNRAYSTIARSVL